MKGKIIKKNGKYFTKSVVLYVLEEFKLRTPVEITISQKWDRCTHACCICGISDNTDNVQAQACDSRLVDRPLVVCDLCLKEACPELYSEVVTQRKRFWAKCRKEAKRFTAKL